MRGGRHTFVIVSFLLLSSILENEEVHAAVFALPSNWMRPLKSKATTTTTTPKPRITDSVESQKGISMSVCHQAFPFDFELACFLKIVDKEATRLKLMELMILKEFMQLRKRDPLFERIWETFQQIMATKAARNRE